VSQVNWLLNHINHLKWHGSTGLWRYHQPNKEVKSSNKDWLTANVFDIHFVQLCTFVTTFGEHKFIQKITTGMQNMTLT
jgi:hypothetical protein